MLKGNLKTCVLIENSSFIPSARKAGESNLHVSGVLGPLILTVGEWG